MTLTASLQSRPPGVSFRVAEPRPGIQGVRLDTCAFAGVSRRGPARVQSTDPETSGLTLRTVPVLVESWADFELRFGGLRGPGLLPISVAAFFENGGQRAYVLRIVHAYGDHRDAEGVAASSLAGLLDLATLGQPVVTASDEGAWGNGLAVTGTFRMRAAGVAGDPTGVLADPGAVVGRGALLRLRLDDGSRPLRWVEDVATDLDGTRHLVLDQQVTDAIARAEVVTLDLTVRLADEDLVERHDDLGLHPGHHRFASDVLASASAVLRLPGAGRLRPVSLGPTALVESVGFAGGEDRHPDIVPADFFDLGWVPGDEPGAGVHAITDLDDVGLLCVPDLYAPLPPVDDARVVVDAGGAGKEFAECVDAPAIPQTPREDPLRGLRLDPQADFEVIVALQQRLVELTEQLRCPVVLLDVPPDLPDRRVREWRSRFESTFAAGYHPWLAVPTIGAAQSTRPLNPSAAAAGIIARRELTLGIAAGPANEVAWGAVDLRDRLDDDLAGDLHHRGVNVYRLERDGVRLWGARTLSRNRHYRQLSVRRLITSIVKTLHQRMQWVVFEPHNAFLRAEVRHALRSYLRGLYRAGAFRGGTEAEAFFVRCDETNNPRPSLDAGRLVAEIGVAPAEPAEFIDVTLVAGGDATLRIEAGGG